VGQGVEGFLEDLRGRFGEVAPDDSPNVAGKGFLVDVLGFGLRVAEAVLGVAACTQCRVACCGFTVGRFP
jgi:hypothetical protein